MEYEMISKKIFVAIMLSTLCLTSCQKTKETTESKQCIEIFNIKNRATYNKAFPFCQTAAEQGYPQAQYYLGEIYQYKHDNDKAKEWYIKAVQNNISEAAIELGLMAKQDEDEKIFLSREKGKYDEAIKWFQKADELGNSYGDLEIGNIYYLRYNDYHKAAEYYEKSAKKDNKIAMQLLASIYQNPRLIEPDYAKAKMWYEKAAQLGMPNAQYELAKIYIKGEGTNQDYKQAKFWLEQAIENDKSKTQKIKADAQFLLGEMYLDGKGVERNLIKAKEYLSQSCIHPDKRNIVICFHIDELHKMAH